MCGIAGIFGRRDDALVREMLATLDHRGPDDAHVASGDGWTLGATRLSIIDVAGGRQPLANEDGRVVACQNGEIYDFVELRAELEARGHAFRTRTDTEVIVHGHEEWGDRLAAKLVGMFAIAIRDERSGEGILIRDRIGKKPLYYHVAPDGAVIFASEIKALLLAPSVSREIDPVAIDLFLSLKNVPCPRTAFRDVRALPPGHRLVHRAGRIEIERYHTLDASRACELEDDELEDAIVERLTRAVDRRLRSDVPIGFFLSGGVDSSLVAAIAATRSPRPIHTYTLTYDAEGSTPEKELDRRSARLVADRYATVHVEEQIAPGDLSEDLPRIVACFDEPFSGVVSTWYLARRIARDVKVALSGDGADELFGSYASHRIAALIERAPIADEDVRSLWQLDPDFVRRARDEPEHRWRSRLVVLDDAEKRALYSPRFRERLESLAKGAGATSIEDHFRALWSRATARDALGRVLEVELATQLPDQVLAFVDRLSMAHSLEVRAPFLDQDLVPLAMSIGAARKIGERGEVKLALKRAARRFLPSEVIDRPKEGFLMPINAWLSKLGPWVRDVLAENRVKRAGVFEPAAVGALVDRFLGSAGAGTPRDGAKVFSLVVYHLWHELYVESRARSVA